MSRQPTRETTSGRLYLALRKAAKAEGKSTDELLQLHALEAFVERLAQSARARDFVLKGGVLLSAYDVRRPTRDVDLSSRSLPNTPAELEVVVAEIAALPLDDGWTFTTAGAEIIREEAAYSGVRVTVRGTLSSARQEFHVDVSFGDPIVPAPERVTLHRVLGGQISVSGYPLPMVFAEKLMTAVQRGTTNTRWRDYADVCLLSRAHSLSGQALHESLAQVSAAREVQRTSLTSAIPGYAAMAQGKWAPWVRKQGLADRLSVDFSVLLDEVMAFADPILEGHATTSTWQPTLRRWT